MLYSFPKTQQDWLRAISFPFQVYSVVAIFEMELIEQQLPHNFQGMMREYRDYVSCGYLICFLVLALIGFVQLFARLRRRGWLNLCLAALGAFFGLAIPNFVYT